ncbi:MAG: prolipoprotein diacylglyceryl transferase [Alphaproteobacteria bacterium]|nr:prolipoprotein diacylglyceryl transferase [Alphaproteobacteria bacterium]
MLTIPFPQIDPVMVHLGPISIHWYGIAYVVGLLLGWHYGLWLARRYNVPITKKQIDDFIIWALGGIIIGGRLGHILFFEFNKYLQHPLDILMTWKGGMSFHGGLLGVVVVTLLYCYKNNIPTFRFADLIAASVPIGLCLGRVANFINGELYGRVTDVSWGVIFPYAGPLPRHPSQLYEAFLEGIVLFILLNFCWRIPSLRETPGRIAGIFFVGYGLVRTLVEFVREPDTFYKIVDLSLTTGQVLSLPMILFGLYLILRPNMCLGKVRCP